jgi:hypothetical protein
MPLEEVLNSCTADEVRVTTHALVLQMARQSDASLFPAELKAALLLAMAEAGLSPSSSAKEWDAAVQRYLATRPVRDDVLLALQAAFPTGTQQQHPRVR